MEVAGTTSHEHNQTTTDRRFALATVGDEVQLFSLGGIEHREIYAHIYFVGFVGIRLSSS